MRQEGLEIKNRRGTNALHLATFEGYMHIVKMLVSLMRPEAFEEKDGEGYTALSLAVAFLKDGDVYEIGKNMAERNDQVIGIPTFPE